MRRLAIFFIRGYQLSVSPDHGILRFLYPNGYCQFHPTCSQYALGVFERHGTIKGAVLSTKRLLRCHPWSKGGIDEVPR